MGQLQRGSKDENVCPLLGGWVSLGKTQGGPGPSPPRGGEAHSRHQRRRAGASTRSPRSPGTARWSWPWLERWTSGRWFFHRAWKRRLGLERSSWRWQLPAVLLRPPAPPAKENSCPRLRVQPRPRGSGISGWARQRTVGILRRAGVAGQVRPLWLSRKLQQILDPASARPYFPH